MLTGLYWFSFHLSQAFRFGLGRFRMPCPKKAVGCSRWDSDCGPLGNNFYKYLNRKHETNTLVPPWKESLDLARPIDNNTPFSFFTLPIFTINLLHFTTSSFSSSYPFFTTLSSTFYAIGPSSTILVWTQFNPKQIFTLLGLKVSAFENTYYNTPHQILGIYSFAGYKLGPRPFHLFCPISSGIEHHDFKSPAR